MGKQIQPSRPPSLEVQASSKVILAPSVLIKSNESRHPPSRKCLDFWPFLWDYHVPLIMVSVG